MSLVPASWGMNGKKAGGVLGFGRHPCRLGVERYGGQSISCSHMFESILYKKWSGCFMQYACVMTLLGALLWSPSLCQGSRWKPLAFSVLMAAVLWILTHLGVSSWNSGATQSRSVVIGGQVSIMSRVTLGTGVGRSLWPPILYTWVSYHHSMNRSETTCILLRWGK
jgi:hypothetical protein